MLFVVLWLCSIIWNQILWYFHYCSLCSGLLFKDFLWFHVNFTIIHSLLWEIIHSGSPALISSQGSLLLYDQIIFTSLLKVPHLNAIPIILVDTCKYIQIITGNISLVTKIKWYCVAMLSWWTFPTLAFHVFLPQRMTVTPDGGGLGAQAGPWDM